MGEHTAKMVGPNVGGDTGFGRGRRSGHPTARNLNGLVLGISSISWTWRDIQQLVSVMRRQANAKGLGRYSWTDDDILGTVLDGCLALNKVLYAKESGLFRWPETNDRWRREVEQVWAEAGHAPGTIRPILHKQVAGPGGQGSFVLNLKALGLQDPALVNGVLRILGEYWEFTSSKLGTFYKAKIKLTFAPDLEKCGDANSAGVHFLSTLTHWSIDKLLGGIWRDAALGLVTVGQLGDDDESGVVERVADTTALSPDRAWELREGHQRLVQTANQIDRKHGRLFLEAWFGAGPGLDSKEQQYAWLATRLFRQQLGDSEECRKQAVRAIKERIRQRTRAIRKILETEPGFPSQGHVSIPGPRVRAEQFVRAFAVGNPIGWKAVGEQLSNAREKTLPDDSVQVIAEWVFDHYFSPEERERLALAGFGRKARARSTAFKNALITRLVEQGFCADSLAGMFAGQRGRQKDRARQRVADLRGKRDKLRTKLQGDAAEYLYLLSSKANWVSNGADADDKNPVFSKISKAFHSLLGQATVIRQGQRVRYWQLVFPKPTGDPARFGRTSREVIWEFLRAVRLGWKHGTDVLDLLWSGGVYKDDADRAAFEFSIQKSWNSLQDTMAKLTAIQEEIDRQGDKKSSLRNV